MKGKIALLGESVEKSLSPAMHNLAFESLSLPYEYQAISVPRENFKKVFTEAQESFRGLNITIPYKETAIPYLTRSSKRVEKLQAVNTVLFEHENGIGENTDVDGFIESVKRTGYSLDKEKSAFVVGAGGAAKAAIEALDSLGVRRFAVATRSPERMDAFNNWFSKHYSAKLVCLDFKEKSSWEKELADTTVFVNAAPLAACEAIPFFEQISFPNGVLVMEWVYLPKQTPWLKKGEQAKGTLVEGYKLLLCQGMKSFEIWTGEKAPEKIMMNALLEKVR